MALDMSPEDKAVGRENFHRVVGKLAAANGQEGRPGVTRRQFMQGLVAAGAAIPVSAAAYFGYRQAALNNRPVRAALIGAGDEGGVLVGEHNPAFVQFVAYSDIRPSNQRRIFDGQPGTPRKGFNYFYGNNARRDIRLFENYEDLLADRNLNIELVVIALPLHLHAPCTLAALQAGKHVLCEKLMAWNITQCKAMIAAADRTQKLLAIGHQRHYSMLYQHAVEIINSGVLGEIRHIRALWHRNNARPLLDDQGNERPDPETPGASLYQDSWRPSIAEEDRRHLQTLITNRQATPGHQRYKDMNELVRWRLYQRTGGGLMAELGSHQLDACSIFLGKVKPLHVTALGGKHFYRDDREVEDHVYCTYEFPGKNYRPEQRDYDRGVCQANDLVTVNYSSISTNAFEPYGECIMGSKGTMIIEAEKEIFLWGSQGRSTAVTASTGGGAPRLDASSSTDPGERRAVETGQNAIGYAPPSRGYREEMEHMAYLIRMREEGMESDRRNLVPRCDGRAAMADAIIALTANKAMRSHQRIRFESDWFAADKTDVPDGDNQVVDL